MGFPTPIMNDVWAVAILKIAAEKINLKTLITEANLKRVGILSIEVGTKCKFTKFRSGIPVQSDSEGDNDDQGAENDVDGLTP